MDISSANANQLGYVGSKPGQRDSNAWFTPLEYIEAVRESLGGHIDLDPFSSIEANGIVQATTFYSEQDDAFQQTWRLDEYAHDHTVFMNPPYAGKLCSQAVGLFLDHWERRTFGSGVFLVNNATETKWFQRALSLANAICLTDHRISFWNADGKKMSGNTRGQAFFYFGSRSELFAESFTKHGCVISLR